MGLSRRKLVIHDALSPTVSVIRDSNASTYAGATHDYSDGFISGCDIVGNGRYEDKVWFVPGTLQSQIGDSGQTFTFKYLDTWTTNRFALNIGARVEFFCDYESNQPTQSDVTNLPSWHVGLTHKNGAQNKRIFYGWIASISHTHDGVWVVTCRDPLWRADDIMLVQEKSSGGLQWQDESLVLPFVIFNAQQGGPNWFWSIKRKNTSPVSYGVGLVNPAIAASVQPMSTQEILQYLQDQYASDLVVAGIFEGGTTDLFDSTDLLALGLLYPPELVFEGVGFATAIRQIIQAHAPNYRLWVDMETLQWRITPYQNYIKRIADPFYALTANAVDPTASPLQQRIYFKSTTLADRTQSAAIWNDISAGTKVLFVRDRTTAWSPRLTINWQDIQEEVYVLQKGGDPNNQVTDPVWLDIPRSDHPGPVVLYEAVKNTFMAGSRVYPLHDDRLASIGFSLDEDVIDFDHQVDDEGVYTAVSVVGRKHETEELTLPGPYDPAGILAPTPPGGTVNYIKPAWSSTAQGRWREMHGDRSFDNGVDGSGAKLHSYTEIASSTQTELLFEYTQLQHGDDTIDDEWNNCTCWIVQNAGNSFTDTAPPKAAKIVDWAKITTPISGVRVTINKLLSGMGLGAPIGTTSGGAVDPNVLRAKMTDSGRLAQTGGEPMNAMKAVFRKFQIVWASTTEMEKKGPDNCDLLAQIKQGSWGVEQHKATPLQPLLGIYAALPGSTGGQLSLVGGIFPIEMFKVPYPAINPDVSNTCIPGQTQVAPEITMKVTRQIAEAFRARIPDVGYSGRAYILHGLERELALVIDEFDSTKYQADYTKIAEYLFHLLSEPGEQGSITLRNAAKWLFTKDLHFRLFLGSSFFRVGGNTIQTSFRPVVESVNFDFENDTVVISGRSLGSILGTGFFEIYERILQLKALKHVKEESLQNIHNQICDEADDVKKGYLGSFPLDCSHGQVTGGLAKGKGGQELTNMLGGDISSPGISSSDAGGTGVSGSYATVNQPSLSVGASAITGIYRDVYGNWFQSTPNGTFRRGTVSGSTFTPSNTDQTYPQGTGGQALADLNSLLNAVLGLDAEYEAPPVYATIASATSTTLTLQYPYLIDAASYVNGSVHVDDGVIRATYRIQSHTTSVITLTASMSEGTPAAGRRIVIRAKPKPVPDSSDFAKGSFGFKDVLGNWFVAEPSGTISQATLVSGTFPMPDTLDKVTPQTTWPRLKMVSGSANASTQVRVSVPLIIDGSSLNFGALFVGQRDHSTGGQNGDGTGIILYFEDGSPLQGHYWGRKKIAGTATTVRFVMSDESGGADFVLEDAAAASRVGVQTSTFGTIAGSSATVQAALDSIDDILATSVRNTDFTWAKISFAGRILRDNNTGTFAFADASISENTDGDGVNAGQLCSDGGAYKVAFQCSAPTELDLTAATDAYIVHRPGSGAGNGAIELEVMGMAHASGEAPGAGGATFTGSVVISGHTTATLIVSKITGLIPANTLGLRDTIRGCVFRDATAGNPDDTSTNTTLVEELILVGKRKKT